jgi:hypothetical protein
MLVRLLLLALLMSGASPAAAGMRAIYGGGKLSHSIHMKIADNGDFEARTGT